MRKNTKRKYNSILSEYNQLKNKMNADDIYVYLADKYYLSKRSIESIILSKKYEVSIIEVC